MMTCTKIGIDLQIRLVPCTRMGRIAARLPGESGQLRRGRRHPLGGRAVRLAGRLATPQKHPAIVQQRFWENMARCDILLVNR